MKTIPNAKQFAVLGLGRFGSTVAKRLYSLVKEVLAVDVDEQRVADIADYVTHSMVGDCLDEPTLKQIDISSFEVVVVAIAHDMEASILATLLCKEMGVKYIIAKAQSMQHSKVLEKIGADMVVFPELETGHKLGTLLASPAMVEIAELAPNFKIIDIEAPEEWQNKSLIELKIRNKNGLTVLLVNRDQKVISTPSGEFVLQGGDKVVLCGEEKYLRKFSKII